jgi:hypothetical protein
MKSSNRFKAQLTYQFPTHNPYNVSYSRSASRDSRGHDMLRYGPVMGEVNGWYRASWSRDYNRLPFFVGATYTSAGRGGTSDYISGLRCRRVSNGLISGLTLPPARLFLTLLPPALLDPLWTFTCALMPPIGVKCRAREGERKRKRASSDPF